MSKPVPVFTKPEAAAMQAEIAALNALVPSYAFLTGDTAQERHEIGALLWDAVTELRDAARTALKRLLKEAADEEYQAGQKDQDVDEILTAPNSWTARKSKPQDDEVEGVGV